MPAVWGAAAPGRGPQHFCRPPRVALGRGAYGKRATAPWAGVVARCLDPRWAPRPRGCASPHVAPPAAIATAGPPAGNANNAQTHPPSGSSRAEREISGVKTCADHLLSQPAPPALLHGKAPNQNVPGPLVARRRLPEPAEHGSGPRIGRAAALPGQSVRGLQVELQREYAKSTDSRLGNLDQ